MTSDFDGQHLAVKKQEWPPGNITLTLCEKDGDEIARVLRFSADPEALTRQQAWAQELAFRFNLHASLVEQREREVLHDPTPTGARTSATADTMEQELHRTKLAIEALVQQDREACAHQDIIRRQLDEQTKELEHYKDLLTRQQYSVVALSTAHTERCRQLDEMTTERNALAAMWKEDFDLRVQLEDQLDAMKLANHTGDTMSHQPAHGTAMLAAEFKYIKSLAAPGSEIANSGGRAIAMLKHPQPQGRRLRVVLESPYAGDTVRNVTYARAALRDSLNRGEAPIASHLLHTQVLNDNDPAQRRIGIDAGLTWIAQADRVVFYQDLGRSAGMEAAQLEAQRTGTPCEVRYLGGVWAS